MKASLESGAPFPAQSDPIDAVGQSRRDFLKRIATGLIVVVALRETEMLAAVEPAKIAAPRAASSPDFNAFLRIGEDGRVTCYTGKIEMGQGPVTSLPQVLADELDVPLDQVDLVMGDTELCPFDPGTWGSMTTRFFGPVFRAAAAEAKAVLLALAAESLDLLSSELVIDQGVIYDRDHPERRVSYGELTKGRRIERRVDVSPTLKDRSQFTLIGKPQRRRDAREKVTGEAKFAGDIRLPGMLYARIVRPPAHGATRRRVDTGPAEQIAGVRVVRDDDLVAVLHEIPDVADEALERIRAKYDVAVTGLTDETIFDHLLKHAGSGRIVQSEGDVAEGRRNAQRAFAMSYFNSYVAHATIETHTALANFENDKLTVWASTQTPFGTQREIADALGFPLARVRVIAPYVGGGFGGKAANAQAIEAARLAKQVGRPVQVMRTREEEFFYDTFRPAAIVKVDAGVDETGAIVYWDFDEYFAGERGADHFYAIPHHRTQTHTDGPSGAAGTHPFATGAWRAPGNNTNTFARESHLDMLATAARVDPVEFRLRNLKDERMIRVLKAAAERFGWTPGVAPSRRGFGVACGIDAGTYVAFMAEVAVDPRKGNVQVKRVVCAQDMGLVINPAGAVQQIEGGIIMGLGYALTEEQHFRDGAMVDKNFDTYEIPRFSSVPQIEAVLVDNPELGPMGGGEPSVIGMGAVIANAIYDATGQRLLQLPMTPGRVRAALRAV